jgi:hypothetical protein
LEWAEEGVHCLRQAHDGNCLIHENGSRPDAHDSGFTGSFARLLDAGIIQIEEETK